MPTWFLKSDQVVYDPWDENKFWKKGGKSKKTAKRNEKQNTWKIYD